MVTTAEDRATLGSVSVQAYLILEGLNRTCYWTSKKVSWQDTGRQAVEMMHEREDHACAVISGGYYT